MSSFFKLSFFHKKLCSGVGMFGVALPPPPPISGFSPVPIFLRMVWIRPMDLETSTERTYSLPFSILIQFDWEKYYESCSRCFIIRQLCLVIAPLQDKNQFFALVWFFLSFFLHCLHQSVRTCGPFYNCFHSYFNTNFQFFLDYS